MQFRLIRLFDHILGSLLFFAAVPLCLLVEKLTPTRRQANPRRIVVLKLHGGGSLLMAMPALLGLRRTYPQANIMLVGTQETRKFAELTGVFDDYRMVDTGSAGDLIKTGLKALMASRRSDILLDFEPHSTLAAVFAPFTMAARRIGFIQAGQYRRARSYTHPIYFNLNAPVYVFYEQAVSLLNAEPATAEACRDALREGNQTFTSILKRDHPKPWVYASAFTSSLSPERMLPAPLWLKKLEERLGKDTAFTLVVGGGPAETAMATAFAARVQKTFAAATVIQTCGVRNLREAMADIDQVDEFWGVDSGPLHIARILGKKSVSFWGPSNPAYRLRPVPGLEEDIFYRALPCSPCVHLGDTSPCKGDNQCMKKLFSNDLPAPITRF